MITVVIGIDGEVFNHDFGIDHHDFNCVLAGSNSEGGIQPSKIVEHLITPRQSLGCKVNPFSYMPYNRIISACFFLYHTWS